MRREVAKDRELNEKAAARQESTEKARQTREAKREARERQTRRAGAPVGPSIADDVESTRQVERRAAAERQAREDAERRARAEREIRSARARFFGDPIAPPTPATTPVPIGMSTAQMRQQFPFGLMQEVENRQRRLTELANTRAAAAKAAADAVQREVRMLPPAGGTGQGYQGGLTPAEVYQRALRDIQTGGVVGPGAGQPGLAAPFDPNRPVSGNYYSAMQEKYGPTGGKPAKDLKDLDEAARRTQGGMRGLHGQLDTGAPAWRRHGALTSEFFETLARGEVNLREMRWQMGVTMAKFGGWLVAGGAIFAVVDAFRALKDGALDSLEGVNTLQRIIPRVDTDKAQEEFRKLSAEMNLPIGDVAAAAYGMSKVFGSISDPAEALEQTLMGTQAALFAVKVGELSVADATRYLTSIVQGFELEGEQLIPLFDTINEAQNRFGGNVGDMTKGVAQAAGTFGQMGGNFRNLIALIQTGTRVTGRTGTEIATALRRSLEIVQRPERRQRIIDLLGIDPRDSSAEQIIERAMQVIRRVPREQQVAIARAISTPELASGRILPLLRSGELYRTIQGELTPDQTQGSAQTELERALRGPREEIAKIGNNLQRLGGALAEAGALDALGLMLRLTNGILSGFERIASIFSALPQPLRSALAIFLEIAAVTALIRRFTARGGGPYGAGYAPPAAAAFMQAQGMQVVAGPRGPGIDPYTGGVRGGTYGPATQPGRLAQRAQAATAAMRRQGPLLSAAASALTVTARAGQGFAGGLAALSRRTVAMVGPIEGIILAATALAIGYQKARERQEEAERLMDHYDRLSESGTPDEIRRERRPEPNMLERAQGAVADAWNGVLGFARSIGGQPGQGLLGRGVPGIEPSYRSEQAAWEALQKRVPALEGERSRGAGLSVPEIRKRLRDRLRTAQTREERVAAYEQAQHEYENGLFRRAKKPGAARKAVAAQFRDEMSALVADLRVTARNLYTALDAVGDLEDFERYGKVAQNRVRRFGLTPALQARLGAAAARGRELAALESDPERQAQILSQVEELERTLDEHLKERMDRALEFSRSAAEGGAARAEYIQGRRRAEIGQARRFIARRQRAIARNADRLREISREYAVLNNPAEGPPAPGPGGAGDFGAPGLGRMPGDTGGQEQMERNRQKARAELRRERRKLERTARVNRKRIAELRRGIKEREEDLAFLEKQYARNTFEESLIEAESGYDLRAARQLDPVAKARTEVAKARDQLRRIREGFRRGFKRIEDLNRAEAELEGALQAAAEESLSAFESRQDLAAARFGFYNRSDEGAQLKRAVADARDTYAQIRSTPNLPNRGQRLQAAQAEIYRARTAYADWLERQGEELRGARLELALSRTDDPVKQALLRMRDAADALRDANTPPERILALANLNSRKREYRNERFRSRQEDIEFDLEMERIDRSQAIRRYETLLKAVKGNKALRREIQRRIHALKKEAEQESEVELNVGNIRLPTIYDVRRLARQGTQNSVVQHFNFQIDGSGDPDAVASAVVGRMAHAGATGLRSAQRAAGTRRG